MLSLRSHKVAARLWNKTLPRMSKKRLNRQENLLQQARTQGNQVEHPRRRSNQFKSASKIAKQERTVAAQSRLEGVERLSTVNVGCADIDRMLEAMGADAKNSSLCIKAAIMKGHIKITGKEGDLEKVVHKEEGMCGHMIEATLGDLLKQPDYAGFDYEMGLENATVVCKVKSFYCFRVVSEDGKNIKEI